MAVRTRIDRGERDAKVARFDERLHSSASMVSATAVNTVGRKQREAGTRARIAQRHPARTPSAAASAEASTI
jgi:hypothetical protein